MGVIAAQANPLARVGLPFKEANLFYHNLKKMYPEGFHVSIRETFRKRSII